MLQVDEVDRSKIDPLQKTILDRLRLEFKEPLINDNADALTKLQKRDFILKLIEEMCASLSAREKRVLLEELLQQAFSPLDALMADPYRNDICINENGQLLAAIYGRWEDTKMNVGNAEQVKITIDRLISPLGLKLDQSCPMVSAELPGNWLLEATIPPISIDGPALSLHRPTLSKWSFGNLVGPKDEPTFPKIMLTENMANILKACVQGRVNIIVSGPSNSGKTAMLNALCQEIKPYRFSSNRVRVISIEYSPELSFNEVHLLRLQPGPLNWRGERKITPQMVVQKAIRMNVSRIVLGDCYGPEAFDLISAMGDSLQGSMATVNAQHPRDCLAHLENMMLMRHSNTQLSTARYFIARTHPLIVQVRQLEDGTRRVTEIAEVQGLKHSSNAEPTEKEQLQQNWLESKGLPPDAYKLATLFHLEREGRHATGHFKCKFVGAGLPPQFLEQLEQNCAPFELNWLK